MPRKLFHKMFLAYFSLFLMGFIILFFITRLAFQNFYFNEVTTNLVQKAHIIESDIYDLISNNKYKELNVKIKFLSEKSNSRITVIKTNGVVIADSSKQRENLENHLKREEVQEALKKGLGKSIRYSKTLNSDQLYIAIPIKQNDKVIGILRNAVSINELETSLYTLSKNILFWSSVLLIVLSYFIYEQARKVSHPLEKIKNDLEQFAENDFDSELTLDKSSTLEIDSLSNALSLMSIKLKKQIRKVNKQKNEQLAIFSSLNDGVITINPDFSIYHINQAARGYLKYSGNNSLKGVNLKELIQDQSLVSFVNEIFTKMSPVSTEVMLEGSKYFNLYGTIVDFDKSGGHGAVIVLHDVSKVRQLENHRKQFVANVSHELKTPLTAIQGYVETLQDMDLSDLKTTNKFINIIGKHSFRLKAIVEDLLSLSFLEKNIESGHTNFTPVNLKSLLRNCVELCSKAAIDKNIIFKIHGKDTICDLNYSLFEQAIVNLFDNAIKYGDSNSEVLVNLKKTDSYVSISIKNYGPGIDSVHLDRIFERFYSADTARSRELGGSGLGLSIVKHIIISHKGNISVKSNIDEETEFIIELPV